MEILNKFPTPLNFLLLDKTDKIISDNCIDLQGDVVISVASKPSGSETFPLLNFNCKDAPLKSARSVSVVTTYAKAKCEKLNSKTNQQTNSLSITLSSTTDCGGLSSGEVAAIVICTLLIAAIITVCVLVFLKKRRIIFKKKLDQVGREMKN